MRNEAKVLAFVALALLFFGGHTLFDNGQLIWRYWSAEWTRTPAKILSGAIEGRTSRYPDGRGTPRYGVIYEFLVSFEYSVDGHSLTSHRLNLSSSPPNSGNEELEPLLARYPAGRMVEAWYDARDPEFAVLERELDGDSIALTIFGGALALGGCLVGRLAWKYRRYDPPD